MPILRPPRAPTIPAVSPPRFRLADPFLPRTLLASRHVSSPRVDLFARGCYRALAAEETPASWRYLLPLTHVPAPANITITIPGKHAGISRAVRLALKFNRLLIVDAAAAWGIEKVTADIDWHDSLLTASGLLW